MKTKLTIRYALLFLLIPLMTVTVSKNDRKEMVSEIPYEPGRKAVSTGIIKVEIIKGDDFEFSPIPASKGQHPDSIFEIEEMVLERGNSVAPHPELKEGGDIVESMVEKMRIKPNTKISTEALKNATLGKGIIPVPVELGNPFRLHNRADAVLFPNMMPIASSGNILESLQGRVAGVQIMRTGQNQFTALIRGQGPPLYLLDGVPIEESTVYQINQFDISHVEILKSVATAGIYGGRGSNGVIAFFTRRGGE